MCYLQPYIQWLMSSFLFIANLPEILHSQYTELRKILTYFFLNITINMKHRMEQLLNICPVWAILVICTRVIQQLKIQKWFRVPTVKFYTILLTALTLATKFSICLRIQRNFWQPEVSLRGEKWRYYMVVCAGGGILWCQNTKTHTQAKQMPWQR